MVSQSIGQLVYTVLASPLVVLDEQLLQLWVHPDELTQLINRLSRAVVPRDIEVGDAGVLKILEQGLQACVADVAVAQTDPVDHGVMGGYYQVAKAVHVLGLFLLQVEEGGSLLFVNALFHSLVAYMDCVVNFILSLGVNASILEGVTKHVLAVAEGLQMLALLQGLVDVVEYFIAHVCIMHVKLLDLAHAVGQECAK